MWVCIVRVLHRWGLAFYDFYYVFNYFLDNLVLVYVYSFAAAWCLGTVSITLHPLQFQKKGPWTAVHVTVSKQLMLPSKNQLSACAGKVAGKLV